MLFLQLTGSEVSDGNEDESSHECGVLEGHGEGSGRDELKDGKTSGDEENVGFLQRKSTQGREDQLGDARVQGGGQRHVFIVDATEGGNQRQG